MAMELIEVPDGAPDSADGFLQSDFWAAFKGEFGWRSIKLLVRDTSARDSSSETASASEDYRLLVLVRDLGRGACFAYVPHGPERSEPRAHGADYLATIAESLRPRLPRGCLFVRFDPPWYLAEKAPESEDGAAETTIAAQAKSATRPAVATPLVPAAADVQPPDTVLLDLGPSEEELLSAMKPKWRYNIRLAEKRGVVVADEGVEALRLFYRLYEATSERDRIALHPERYYSRLFTLAADFAAKPGASSGDPRIDLRLWIARHEGQAIAAIVTLFRGRRAVYLYGASSDEKRNLMPAYALQWTAIKAAKAAGCLEYDFYGIPPVEDPKHPMAGLYRFKTGFGGLVVHRAGSYDYPLRPVAYALFRRLEALRVWYFKDFRKRFAPRAR